MIGWEAIRAKVVYVATSEMEMEISDEVIGEERIAFAFWVTRGDGRQLIEHTILHLVGDKIALHWLEKAASCGRTSRLQKSTWSFWTSCCREGTASTSAAGCALASLNCLSLW